MALKQSDLILDHFGAAPRQSRKNGRRTMKLCPFVLALLAIGASTQILAGQADEPSPAVQAAQVPGITDTEIMIGQTMPYSGPISGFATIGRAEQAYFKMINDGGG